MSREKTFYITTTLPYINSEPHIGFAAEIIKADIIARFKRQQGYEVFFNTGTDEHGLKIYRKAQELNMDTQEYCDQVAEKFKRLKEVLNLSYNNFVRTTDPDHIEAAQHFWQLCEKNGDIYKKNYQVNYCVGCEMEKTESELENNRCPLHPNQDLEIIEEENYFFRWSKYQTQLLELYKKNPEYVYPKHRLNEISNFVKKGLQDFSISRLKEKMPWGISVPGDDTQVMYVWFDALINYISSLGWPNNTEQFEKFWPGIQVAGKDNLRQQSAMWQGMLMSAGLPNSNNVLVFGFLTSEGQKISKSLGNQISPEEYTKKFGTDALRYYLISQMPIFADGDFSKDKFIETYNSDLGNDLGNLAVRLTNLIEKQNLTLKLEKNSDIELNETLVDRLSQYQLKEALETIWKKVRGINEYLTKEAPWKIEDATEKEAILENAAQKLYDVALALEPFLPETSEKLRNQFEASNITKGEPLFPRR